MPTSEQREFNFTAIFKDHDEYEAAKEELKKSVLEDFGSRNNPAKIVLGDKSHKATIGRVLVNLLIMKPLVAKGIKLAEEDLFTAEAVTEDSLNDYFDRLLKRSRHKNADFDQIRSMVADTINEMSDLSGKLNILSGSSISFHDFVRLSATDMEAKEIFNQKIESRMQFDQIEAKFDKLGDTIERFFREHKDTELYPFMLSETGINHKQLTQAIGFVGLKPDIDGSVIPVAIEDNYLIGLSDIQNYFINSKGTRKALITNNKMVKRSGYLTRKLSLAMIDRYHDNSTADCGTEHFIKYNIESERKLRQIDGRHYYLLDAKGERASTVRTANVHSKDLVGKTIGLRSPVTCAGKHVCKMCYGYDLSEINKDLNTGLISVLLLTNPLTQKLLSAKHLLTTKTDKVEWGEKFLEFFSVNMNGIYFNEPDLTLVAVKGDAEDEDELDDEELPFIKSFELFQNGKKVLEYTLPKDIKFYYEGEPLSESDEDEEEEKLTFEAKDYLDDEPVFTFMAKNNELTQSLQEILSLIESSKHLDIQDYHGVVNKFNDLLISNKLTVASVHAEMITSVLIRDKATGKRLDFRKKNLDEYTIVRVSKAVLNSPLSVSMAFERIEDQLVDLNTYEKDEESLMDHLYK